ncbi:RsiV family protein [Lysinibacillus pakistanensis]|uniref:RsiV family protein n=1 Tax=Lysinibacillus pakistanensis TaxID=759811 RepID=A0AAX3WS84_9BACI|nr:RsiV family protein [Lysinibacillus pakistanensis]MDM5234027.1 RsiV family protein [Lysinibacillus pakistanensis]WHY44630.1 RsiV family protein [Lysinibacillus pakistanensis]WHY49638.1 RsiV family protein [Lysinibacillus pakistanensis]
MDEKLKELEKQYNKVPIPKELDFVVEHALQQGKKKRKKRAPQWLLGSAAAAMLFTAGLNVSPAMARTLSEIPVVGSVVKVLTWTEYEVAEDTYDANIKVPSIENLENQKLANTLNEKYRAEGKALYDNFITEVGDLKANGGGHLGVDSGYDIKTDNDQILSIGRYTVNTVASSSTTMHYDTIDKQNEILITLPMLFKDDSYIKTISENIIEQMRKQAASDSDKVFWVKGGGIPDKELFEEFKTINAEQQFYISDKGKLVISFDKYEVAPGYMGVVEFEIPTDVLKNDLVSMQYIH